MILPEDLRYALAEKLQTVSQKSLTQTVDRLSKRYRDGHAHNQPAFLHSKEDVTAYAAFRLPATFAAIYAALIEVQKRRPDWQPRTLLDIGAGPGTAMWAATALWPGLEQITLLERDQHMIAFGKSLATHAHSLAAKQASWQSIDLIGKWECASHDLVIGAYTLGEFPLSTHKDLINHLWTCSTDTLLIVEPGTPRGFSLVRQVRTQLLATGASMLAPCPHDQLCPMQADDWCHASRRITRTPLHRTVKNATLSYEDEKFSYVALSRTKGLPIKGRVIRHPLKRNGQIHLELCTPDGLKHSIVTRSQRDAFREAKDLHWGSAISDGLSKVQE